MNNKAHNLPSETLYEGKLITVKKLEDRWEVVEHADAVCVLVRRDGEVLGVTQHRPAIGETTWEIPAGLIDDGESPEEAAARELAEEVQLKGTLELITQVYTSPGFSTEKIFIYEATDVSETPGQPDEGEAIELSWRNTQEVWRAIRDGKLATSSPTALALLYALSPKNTIK